MIESFTVGAIFKLVDEASPTLRKVLAEVRELNKVLDQARANLASMGTFAMPAGLGRAVTRCALVPDGPVMLNLSNLIAT
jgi:hypothetical protein